MNLKVEKQIWNVCRPVTVYNFVRGTSRRGIGKSGVRKNKNQKSFEIEKYIEGELKKIPEGGWKV